MPGALYTYSDGLTPQWTLTLNGKAVEPKMQKGFAVIERSWKRGDQVVLTLPMSPRLNVATEKMEANRGRLAVTCGPLVYAAEAADNDGAPQRFAVNKEKPDCQVEVIDTGILKGLRGLSVAAWDVGRSNRASRLRMIPYFAWNNRGDFQPMSVWLAGSLEQAKNDCARLSLVESKKYGKVTATFTGLNDFLGAVTDGAEPAASNDARLPRWTSLPQRNKQQTLTFEFEQQRKVSQVQVYWADDGQEVRVPDRWSLERKVNGRWEDYGKYITDDYEVEKDKFNAVMPNEVKVSEGIRINMQPQAKSCVGIFEVKIDE